jgi:hypothetical protein
MSYLSSLYIYKKTALHFTQILYTMYNTKIRSLKINVQKKRLTGGKLK